MKAPIPAGRLGAGDRCPLCGATSGVTEDGDGYACVMCGGPRIVVDPAIPRSGREKPLLERARELTKRRAAWGAMAGTATAFGALALAVSGVLSLVVHLGEGGGEIAAALVLGPLLFGAFGFSRVRSASRGVESTLSEAELAVAADLAEARGAPLDGTELSRLLHVSPERGEQLSAGLQVERYLASEGEAPAVRVRIDPGEGPDPEGSSADTAHKSRSS